MKFKQYKIYKLKLPAFLATTLNNAKFKVNLSEN